MAERNGLELSAAWKELAEDQLARAMDQSVTPILLTVGQRDGVQVGEEFDLCASLVLLRPVMQS